MRRIGVAGLQLAGEPGGLDRIAEAICDTKRRLPWVDLILLPELAVFGPQTKHAEPEDGPAERRLREVARQVGVWLVPGSLFQRRGAEVFNTAPIIDPAGAIVARYRKIFPWRPYETGVSEGGECCVFTIPDVGCFGVSICYDLYFPEVARSLAWLGAEAILCPSLTSTIDRDVELALARGSAASNQCFLFNVNWAAPLGVGRSIVCGPGGEVLHEALSGAETIAVELDLDYVASVRERGWHGIGQALKSFRDCRVHFPAYAGGRSPALDALGPLTVPTSALGAAPGERRRS